MKFDAKLLIFPAMMAGIALLAADLPPATPAPVKLTEAEQLRLVRAQDGLHQVQLNMKQVEDYYRNLQSQQDTLQKAYDAAVAEVKNAHQCGNCTLDQKQSELLRPALPVPAKK